MQRSACSERDTTADQLEMFRNLPPEQQQAILQQLAGGQADWARWARWARPRQDQSSRGALGEQFDLDRLRVSRATQNPPSR